MSVSNTDVGLFDSQKYFTESIWMSQIIFKQDNDDDDICGRSVRGMHAVGTNQPLWGGFFCELRISEVIHSDWLFS